NTGMYENPVTQKNLEAAKALGYELVEPEVGYLACGDTGKGKLADINLIEERILHVLEASQQLKGKRVLVTAGPTREALDPVRFLSNHSSGKMGYEIARAARDMGAEVTLISGPVNISAPQGVRVIPIISAQDMFHAVQQEYASHDIIIKAAAVGDYRAQKIEENKIKKQGEILEVTFVKNPDILAWLGEHRLDRQTICGFAMETEHLLEHATEKLNKKNCDMIVANNLHEQGAGFQGDTNVVTLIQKDHTETLDLMSKYEVGVELLTRLAALSKEKGESLC
ncbi:MAG: bifunctional phosphopantothenoylcysteine decarboxylase/phosphopantothenate--cysteine ligase CoaBC, partial [Clostridium sp.]